MLVLAYFCAGFGDGRGFQKHLKVPEKYLKTSTKPRFTPKKFAVRKLRLLRASIL